MVSIKWELAFHFVWRNPRPPTRTTPSFELKNIFTVRQRNCRKVIFSVMCVCLSVHMFPCDHLHWCHWSVTDDMGSLLALTTPYRDAPPLQPFPLAPNLLNLDITIQGPDPCPPDMFTLIVYCRQVGSWHPTKMLSCRTHQLTWRAVK